MTLAVQSQERGRVACIVQHRFVVTWNAQTVLGLQSKAIVTFDNVTTTIDCHAILQRWNSFQLPCNPCGQNSSECYLLPAKVFEKKGVCFISKELCLFGFFHCLYNSHNRNFDLAGCTFLIHLCSYRRLIFLWRQMATVMLMRKSMRAVTVVTIHQGKLELASASCLSP